MRFVQNDGGRQAAGYKGKTGDCVCRAIAIASGKDYQDVYETLADGNASQRKSKRMDRAAGKQTAAEGIGVSRKWFKDYMRDLGFKWFTTMTIGSGCKTHLKEGELPMGRLVVALSKHYCAVVDGVIHDTYDGSRGGKRCVYGYWKLEDANEIHS